MRAARLRRRGEVRPAGAAYRLHRHAVDHGGDIAGESAGSASLGRSPSVLARFNRSRTAFRSPPACAQLVAMHLACSPAPAMPCTMRHPRGCSYPSEPRRCVAAVPRCNPLPLAQPAPLAEHVVLRLVAVERLAEQRLLAAEGGVEARRIDAHGFGQVGDARRPRSLCARTRRARGRAPGPCRKRAGGPLWPCLVHFLRSLANLAITK